MGADRDGPREVEGASELLRLVEREGFLAAEIEGDEAEPLTVEQVRYLLDGLRR